MDVSRPITPISEGGESECVNHGTPQPTNTTSEGGQTFQTQVALQLPAGPPKSTIHEYVTGQEDSKMTKLGAERSRLPPIDRHQHEEDVGDPAQSIRTSMHVVNGSVTDPSSVPGLTNTTSSGAAESVSTGMGCRHLDRSNRHLLPGQSDALEILPPPPPQAVILPCPFHFLCHREFNGLHERQWLAHSLEHFEKEDRHGRRIKVDPPSDSCCPFCEKEFWAPRGKFSWEDRMSHVKLHHQFGCRLAHIRPDFALIEYLWQKSIIDPRIYRDLKPKQAFPSPPSSDDGDGAITVLNKPRRSGR